MLTDRPDGSPYDALAGAGITPASTMAEVRDASFHFMERRGWTPDVRRAWDELRTVERRLVVDVVLGVGPRTDAGHDDSHDDSHDDGRDATHATAVDTFLDVAARATTGIDLDGRELDR